MPKAQPEFLFFGPPLEAGHGQAVVHSFVCDYFRSKSVSCEYVDSVEVAGNDALRKSLGRIRAVRTLFKRIAANRVDVVYMTLSSGLGLLSDLVILLLLKKGSAKVVIHHHSAWVVNTPAVRRLVRRLANIHVVLDEEMGEQLGLNSSAYLVVPNAACVLHSNQRYLPDETKDGTPIASRVRPLGFLGRVEPEKGSQVLVSAAAQGANIDVAGPLSDGGLDLSSSLGQGTLNLHGPLSGQDKFDFLDGVETLLFPSQYKIEAQPLVIYEAWMAGCKIVASDVGYVRSQLESHPSHAVLPSDADALDWIAASERISQTGPAEVRASFLREVDKSIASLDYLVEVLSGERLGISSANCVDLRESGYAIR